MMRYYSIVLLSILVLITGCSQNEADSKGVGSSTPATAIASATSSQQTARIALVIGNADYREDFNPLQLGKLSNPVNDAADIAEVLESLGFQVILKTDLQKKTAMKQAVHEFIQRLKANDVGLFYFSGHGFQHNNINYLVPLRADIHNDIDIEGEALAVQYVLRQMERATQGVKLMILDACRENIPADFFRKTKGAFAGVTKGFSSSLNAPMNTLIIYATAANEVSWGGLPGERNSVYTKHLVDVLRQQPHAMVETLLKGVRQRVVQDTQDVDEPQVPWESGSLVTQPFCFGACGSEEQEKLAQQRAELEQQRILLEQQRAAREQARQQEAAKQAELARRKAEEQEKLAQQRAELEQQRIQLEQQRAQLAQEQARQQEAARQAELEQQREQARQQEAARQAELARLTELARRKVEQEREATRQAELRLKAEQERLAKLEAQLSGLSSYRYTDNGDGTVTDNRSGLIWLKNANCFGEQDWKTAMQSAAELAHGQCGLRDGSRAGMWRLPTREEWEAMIDKKYDWPALSNAAGTGPWKEGDAFSGVQTNYYWSSTAYAYYASDAWHVYLSSGYVGNVDEASSIYVWPVRGGK
jgi:uncharacterized caspase-like protein